jgi:hypothetical protein
MSENTIIVIDNDDTFKDRFNYKLKEEDIQDQYKIYPLTPVTTVGQEQLIANCLGRVQDIISTEANVIGIFVDIVIIESGGTLDVTGIMIAAKLRESYPNLPIFNITGKDTETDIISQATLEDVDGVLIKNFLEGKSFSAKRLKTIFKMAALKRLKYKNADTVRAHVELPEEIKKAFNTETLDPRVKRQIEEIGAGEFWTLLSKLLPNANGVVSYMRPGKSGAYVFRVTAKISEEGRSATRPKGWIVKVADRPELLEREIQNYQEMTLTPLPRSFYPKLFGSTPVRVGGLAGMAVELEESSNSLLSAFADLSEEGLKKIAGAVSRILADTYGDPVKKWSNVWNEYFRLDSGAAQKILASLEQHETIFKRAAGDWYRRVFNFVNTGGSTEGNLMGLEGEVDLRTIHGDFNSRNLLVDSEGHLVLIDFFSRRQDHVAKDIAKLERDVVFRVMDASSLEEHSWERITAWRSFLSLNKKGGVFSNQITADIEDPHVRKCATFIAELRASLKIASPQIKEEEYLCALLHYSLFALAHSEISVHKKAFAIEYSSHILSSFD